MSASVKPRKILVTASLAYANGPLHLGHLVEYYQADIWARFQRLRGNHCLYIGGSDAHGTPIMLAAQAQKQDPKTYVKEIQQQHAQDFADAGVGFDTFYITDSPEAESLLSTIYAKLQTKSDIEKREITQPYDEQAGMFLPDRFIKGDCPRCQAADQYGDNCEACGATYSNTELVNAYSVLSGTPPVMKQTEHYFFALANYSDALKAWITDPQHLQTSVAHKTLEWFADGLKNWDISRDAPYFGIKIPGCEDKYFYVWFDAPLGYISIFQHLCNQRSDLNWNDYWDKNSDTELHQFIGKDIQYFHCLFWPALLMSADLRTPTSIHTHGFLTVNGKKMSKSRGTFVTARQYLDQFSPEYLRYYFAAKLNDQVEDIDLNAEDFVSRVNADLVGKFANIASRCARFINRDFDNQLADSLHDPELWQAFVDHSEVIAEHYEKRHYAQAVRCIMQLADRANQYIDQHKPWTLAKQNPQDPLVQLICSQGLQCFRALALWLSPILPHTACQIAGFLNTPLDNWSQLSQPLLGHRISPFKPLLTRLDLAAVTRLFSIEDMPN